MGLTAAHVRTGVTHATVTLSGFTPVDGGSIPVAVTDVGEVKYWGMVRKVLSLPIYAVVLCMAAGILALYVCVAGGIKLGDLISGYPWISLRASVDAMVDGVDKGMKDA